MENEREKAKGDLRAFADKYGLSAQELKNLAAEVAQELEKGQTVLSEVMENVSSKLEVGWFAFEGKKFSPDPYAYPNCQGVVAWLNPDPNAPKGKRGLILTPDAMLKLWADEYCKTEICDEEDGKTNTRRLIAYGKKHGISFPAAEWCYRYSKNGVKPGEGFLPAKNQLKRIVANRNIINMALKKIDGQILNGCIWASSEYSSNNYAEIVNANDGNVFNYIKYYYYYVRCVIAF